MSILYGQPDLEGRVAENINVESAFSLADDEGDHNEFVVYSVHGELLQLNRLKGIFTKFSIVNEHYLLIDQKSVFGRKGYHIHMGYLGDKPKRRIIIAWAWLAVAAGFVSTTGAVYKHGPEFDFPYKSHILLSVLFGCTVLAVLSLFIFLYQTRYRHVLCSRTGKIPVVELMPGEPDRKQYRRFRELLKAHMRRARNDLNPDKALAGELREHRVLYEAGMLDKKGYDRAKSMILGRHGRSPGR